MADVNEITESKPKRELVTDFSKGIFGTSDNFLMATQMAKALSSSTIVPKEFQGNLGNCIIAIDLSTRMHMAPTTVMQNLHIIYGRPSWSSKFLIAMINGSNKFDQPLRFREEEKDGKPYACAAWTSLNGEVIEGMKVTMDIAKAEGWIDKNGSKWKTMPQLMLMYRAASFFASLNCPEVTMGLYTTEEIVEGDFIEYPSESVAETVREAQIEAETKTASIPVEETVKAGTKADSKAETPQETAAEPKEMPEAEPEVEVEAEPF